MSSLILDRRDLKLERQGAVLTLRSAERLQRVPLKLVDRIIVSADLELPASLLAYCADQGIALTVIGHRQRVAQLLADGPGDVFRLVAQVEAFRDSRARLRLASRCLRAKLLTHQQHLGALLRRRPEHRLALYRGLERLRERRQALAAGPTTLDGLRGLEGAAARDYFDAFGPVLPPELGFAGRNRRPPKDPANALLSLSYTLLHSNAAAALSAAGLDPRIGFLHDPAWGRASLAADLTEPFRPAMDSLCLRLGAEQQLRPYHFMRTEDAVTLNKAGRATYYPAVESVLKTLRPRLLRAARRLATRLSAMTQGDPR